jgi:hypothetical protein
MKVYHQKTGYVVLGIFDQSVRTEIAASAEQACEIVDRFRAQSASRVALFKLAASERDLTRLTIDDLRKRTRSPPRA